MCANWTPMTPYRTPQTHHSRSFEPSLHDLNELSQQSGDGSVNGSGGQISTKSTKGASKMRRDMINGEIANLRDLLPLPTSTRQRLSQLQLMALVCVYVRKSNYFNQVFKSLGRAPTLFHTPSFGFSKAMSGFLMMSTQSGKLLYISDNAAEYLGHSMEDLLIHGDSLYDIIDKQDHATLQSELTKRPTNGDNYADGSDYKIFLCRMNVTRNSRRQMRFGDQKVVLIRGKFSGVLPLCSRNENVFLSWCTPIAMPETRESIVQGATNIFTSVHELDMRIVSIDGNGEYYLGYKSADVVGLSWYNLLHPESVKDIETKHRLITQSESDRSCICLVRLQQAEGTWIWCHTVIQLREAGDTDQNPNILCTHQILSAEEAGVMQSNGWLYHYYMLHNRLQYNLAYGGHPGSLSSIYPQMLHMLPPPATQPYDEDFNENMYDMHMEFEQGRAEALASMFHPIKPSFKSFNNGRSASPTGGIYRMPDNVQRPDLDRSRSNSCSPASPMGVASGRSGRGVGGHKSDKSRGSHQRLGLEASHNDKNNNRDYHHDEASTYTSLE
ncbi:PAS domain-containing protein cky-1-like isoform X1 [Tigriopus californicus]|uniref:PAS domain-containing protein cky-1-like isoform X1 n=2 Tax=Tigriopus californicus TaxID=6832 RepID=UPI0027DAA264|nr:PAS domain-containing protein cky-1-like isoform X1 [Tigriopus californicus]